MAVNILDFSTLRPSVHTGTHGSNVTHKRPLAHAWQSGLKWEGSFKQWPPTSRRGWLRAAGSGAHSEGNVTCGRRGCRRKRRVRTTCRRRIVLSCWSRTLGNRDGPVREEAGVGVSWGSFKGTLLSRQVLQGGDGNGAEGRLSRGPRWGYQMTGTWKTSEIRMSVCIAQSPSLQGRGWQVCGSVVQDSRNPFGSRERNPPRRKDRGCWKREDTEEDTWPAHDLTQERAADHRADGGRDSGLGRPGTLSAKTWHGTKFSLDQEARAWNCAWQLMRNTTTTTQPPTCPPHLAQGSRTKPSVRAKLRTNRCYGEVLKLVSPWHECQQAHFLKRGKKTDLF